MKGDQAQGNHSDQVADQGQGDDGDEKDDVLRYASFAKIDINKAEGQHGNERAEAAAGRAHENLVAAHVDQKPFAGDLVVHRG